MLNSCYCELIWALDIINFVSMRIWYTVKHRFIFKNNFEYLLEI